MRLAPRLFTIALLAAIAIYGAVRMYKDFKETTMISITKEKVIKRTPE